MIFDINPRYVRTVRRTISATKFTGPWEIMPVTPGDLHQQLWVQDAADAVALKLALPFKALSRAVESH